MTRADQLTAATAQSRIPRDDEIDVHGLTHIGKVRKQNQDHFLLASIHKRIEIHRTSLGNEHRLPFGDRRLAFMAMVADGVGGGEGGAEASATALENVMEYVVSGMDSHQQLDSGHRIDARRRARSARLRQSPPR